MAIRITQFTSYARDRAGHGSQRAGAAWRTLRAQPSWILRATSAAFLIVVGIPVLLLVLLAVLVATVLFLGLWCASRTIAGLRGLWPRSDGRENVRVIRPAGSPPGDRV